MPVAERLSGRLLSCQSMLRSWSELIHLADSVIEDSFPSVLRFGQPAEWKHQKLRASCFHPLPPPLKFLPPPPPSLCIIPKGSLPHCLCRHVIETQSCSCGRFVNSTIGTAKAAVFQCPELWGEPLILKKDNILIDFPSNKHCAGFGEGKGERDMGLCPDNSALIAMAWHIYGPLLGILSSLQDCGGLFTSEGTKIKCRHATSRLRCNSEYKAQLCRRK